MGGELILIYPISYLLIAVLHVNWALFITGQVVVTFGCPPPPVYEYFGSKISEALVHPCHKFWSPPYLIFLVMFIIRKLLMTYSIFIEKNV